MMKQPQGNTRELMFAIPDIIRLLYRVVRDQRTPKLVKAGLAAVGVYLAVPFDIVPDWIPVLGSVDDVVVLTVGVRTLLRQVPEPILHEHWSGERKTLETLLGRNVRNPAGNGSA